MSKREKILFDAIKKIANCNENDPVRYVAKVDAIAVEALGGEASLQSIYGMITPDRRAGRRHWRPKVRQILQMHHTPVSRGRWAL